MNDIILERDGNTHHTMDLNEEEQALLDDMEISTERNIDVFPANSIRKPPNFKPKKTKKNSGGRKQAHFEPEIDAFMNPTKSNARGEPPPSSQRRSQQREQEDWQENPGRVHTGVIAAKARTRQAWRAASSAR